MQPIRFRCCLHMLAFPVLFGPMAAALCVSVAGMWGAQWLAEFAPEGVSVRHAWSGRGAFLSWERIGAVQRIYAKGDFLLLSGKQWTRSQQYASGDAHAARALPEQRWDACASG